MITIQGSHWHDPSGASECDDGMDFQPSWATLEVNHWVNAQCLYIIANMLLKIVAEYSGILSITELFISYRNPLCTTGVVNRAIQLKGPGHIVAGTLGGTVQQTLHSCSTNEAFCTWDALDFG